MRGFHEALRADLRRTNLGPTLVATSARVISILLGRFVNDGKPSGREKCTLKAHERARSQSV